MPYGLTFIALGLAILDMWSVISRCGCSRWPLHPEFQAWGDYMLNVTDYDYDYILAVWLRLRLWLQSLVKYDYNYMTKVFDYKYDYNETGLHLIIR